MTKIADIENLMQEGRWEVALAESRAYVQEQPATPEGHAVLGECEAHFGNLDEAVRGFSRALALRPRHWRAGVRLIECLDKLGRYEEALEVAEHTAKLRPSDEYVLGLLRGLRRQVPERITDGWQLSLKQSWWMNDMKGPEE